MPRKPRGAVEVYLYCTPRTLYLRLRPGTHCKGGCVGTTDGLDGCGKSRPHWDSIPGPSRRSESLYRPGYPGRYSGQRPVSSLPELQFYPVSIIPPMLHTHSFTYHPHYIMFLSQSFCFPCQYHSTNAPHSSSSTRWSYRKDKRARPGNLPKSNALTEIRQVL